MAVQRLSRRGLWLRLGIILFAAAAGPAPLPPAAVERWFSTGIYPTLQRTLTPLSNALPVAWLDGLTACAALWLLWRSWRAVRPGAEPRLRRIGRAALDTATAAAVTYAVFLGLWGLNYRRESVAVRLELAPEAPSTADVFRLGSDAAARLNGLYARAHNAGWGPPAWRNRFLREAFAGVQADLARAPGAVPGRLKATIFGPFFRWTAVDGMINPFGLEVLGNPDLLPFERAFVTAHEWGHLAGYANESEANFVGWLTCLRADAPSQYSGWLYLYAQVAGELPPDERQRLGGMLRDGPRSDLAAIAARLRRGDRPALRRASWLVYDSYLKANRVEEGVRSYDAVVTLILRARFDAEWRPVRRAAPPD